jgi:hypothetical protein
MPNEARELFQRQYLYYINMMTGESNRENFAFGH